MASVGEPLSRSPFTNSSPGFNNHLAKSIPILPSSSASATSAGDPMDISQSRTPPMGPPMHGSPNGDRIGEQPGSVLMDQQHLATNGGNGQPVGAAAAAQQPKVVQTAFIHKLYKSVVSGRSSVAFVANVRTACSKIRTHNTLSPGRVRTRASLCHHRPNSPRS